MCKVSSLSCARFVLTVFRIVYTFRHHIMRKPTDEKDFEYNHEYTAAPV